MINIMLIAGDKTEKLSEFLKQRGTFNIDYEFSSLMEDILEIKDSIISVDKLVYLLDEQTLNMRAEMKLLKELLTEDGFFTVREILFIITERDGTDKAVRCLDVYNVACLLNEGKDRASAIAEYEPFVGKGYTYESLRAFKGCFRTNNVPECSSTLEVMLRYEIRANSVIPLDAMLEHSNVLEAHLAALKQFYRAGFTISYLHEDYGDGTFKRLAKILTYLENVNDAVSKDRALTECIVVGGKRCDFLSADYVFEVIRSIYFEEFDETSVSAAVRHGNMYGDFIYRWLQSLRPLVIYSVDNDYVHNRVSSKYDEVQINCDEGVMFHFPIDFFNEYENEFTKWVKNYQPNQCCLEVYSVGQHSRVLCIFFTKKGTNKATIRNNHIGIYADLATKKELIFNEESRVTCPILKSMLYRHFKKHEKDTSIIDRLDIQTVLAFIQVLILQDSEEYQTLFKRQDSFSSGFQRLRWFVRSDDNFYSAVLRYIMVMAGLRTQYNANCISKSLQETVVVNGKEHDILGVFSGDKTLLEILQNNRDTLHPYLKGDVMYFE
ncbi:MAG: hypothetical protein NC393_10320 [Clostridium sp.]|nr:hypothetical protein [Clostridium sp.]MCM1207497.1 hypothetical protein [Ruminococcus sp.]